MFYSEQVLDAGTWGISRSATDEKGSDVSPTKRLREYDRGLAPSVFRIAPMKRAELTEAQKAAVASRMAEVLQKSEISDEDATVGDSEVDRK